MASNATGRILNEGETSICHSRARRRRTHDFRLAAQADSGSWIVRALAIVPAAVSERDVAGDLLEAGPASPALLAGKGLPGRLRRRPGFPRHRRPRPAR
jgi:IS5 family transposase